MSDETKLLKNSFGGKGWSWFRCLKQGGDLPCGEQRGSDGLLSFRLEERIARDRHLRAIRTLVDEALAALSGRFEELYAHTGRPSIAPEHLLRATLLQAFFTVRSERQLMEQIDYNLLFRWFVGLSIDDAVWDASTFEEPRPVVGGRCGA